MGVVDGVADVEEAAEEFAEGERRLSIPLALTGRGCPKVEERSS
jgi:hypothetical protein